MVRSLADRTFQLRLPRAAWKRHPHPPTPNPFAVLPRRSFFVFQEVARCRQPKRVGFRATCFEAAALMTSADRESAEASVDSIFYPDRKFERICTIFCLDSLERLKLGYIRIQFIHPFQCDTRSCQKYVHYSIK